MSEWKVEEPQPCIALFPEFDFSIKDIENFRDCCIWVSNIAYIATSQVHWVYARFADWLFNEVWPE